MIKKINIAIIENEKIVSDHIIKFTKSHPLHHYNKITKSQQKDSLMKLSALFDILILDLGQSSLSSLNAFKAILNQNIPVEVTLLSAETEDLIVNSLTHRSVSFLCKRDNEEAVNTCIKKVLNGTSHMSKMVAQDIYFALSNRKPIDNIQSLTERQISIMDKLIKGKSYKTIAEELFISVDTVRFHAKKLYKNLNVSTKSEAIAKYLNTL